MRISDWSSDVCSSDLADLPGRADALSGLAAGLHILRDRAAGGDRHRAPRPAHAQGVEIQPGADRRADRPPGRGVPGSAAGDRKSGVEGKRVSVCVDLGGSRIIKKKKTENKTQK